MITLQNVPDTYRHTKELSCVHGLVQLVGNLLVGVRELLDGPVYCRQPLHGFIEGQRHTPDSVVGQRSFLAGKIMRL